MIVDGSVQLGNGTTAQIAAATTVIPLLGQIVLNTQTGQYCIGDGVTALSALTFYGGASSSYTADESTLTLTGSTFSIKTQTSATFMSKISDATGTGVMVRGTSPTFTTDITTPLIRGVSGNLGFTNASQASGSITDFTFTKVAHTGQTASTAVIGFNVLGANKTWVNGGVSTTITQQIENSFGASTYLTSGAGSLTFTEAVGNAFYAPVASGTTINNNFAALFTAGTATIKIGNLTGTTNSPAIYFNQSTPTSSNYVIRSDSSGNTFFNGAVNDGNMTLQAFGNTFLIGNTTRIRFIPAVAATAGAVTSFMFTPPNHTGQDAGVNSPNFHVGSHTKTFLTGAQALQYFNWFDTPTLAFSGASTSTVAANGVFSYVQGGANSTITTNAAIYVPTLALTNTTTGIGIISEAPSGATRNMSLKASNGASGLSLPAASTNVWLEASGTNYLSFNQPDASAAGIVFGSPSDVFGAAIQWTFNNNALDIQTARNSGIIRLYPGDQALRATLSTTALTMASATIVCAAPTTSLSSLKLPHGTAPSSPTNGDMWTTTAGLFVRINGVTVGPLS